MIWVDRIAKKIAKEPQHIDDMFTPSGYAHIGSLRGPILHDVVYRVFHAQNDKTIFTYVFNDYDVIDGLSDDLKKTHEKYMGYVLRMAPSPVDGYESFAHFYTEEMKRILTDLGVNADYLSSWDMYHEGRFNDTIKTALDNRDKILEIYRRVGGYAKKSSDWYPLQVICPNCKKLGTTHVTGWDGEKVTFTCEENLVTWAKGCKYEGTMSPFDGAGKLPWKVDWPAHWKNLGITFEGAGKDHASRGGSYDIAFELSEHVFKYKKPYYLPYEFFLYGGKKMSSSKGIGASSKDIHSILPPEIFRFLIIRTPIERTIEFDPTGDTIPNLFDEYDKCLNSHYDKLENNIPKGKAGEVALDMARIVELSEVRRLSEKRVFLPRFRTILNMIRNKNDLLATFEQQKGAPLNDFEKEILEERTVYAQEYLKNIVGEQTSYEMTKQINTDMSLDANQKLFLKELAIQLKGVNADNRTDVQNVIFSSMKAHELKPREVFSAFYRILIGKDAGPKAADLILEFGAKNVIDRLNLALSEQPGQADPIKKASTKEWARTDTFSIEKKLLENYPTISVGVAIIKNVTIEKHNDDLKQESDALITSFKGLTNETISSYPEVQSYRKLYKQMGIDWHSRRPSPEALLRRIALNKGIYSINTCVDAYNLIVMKNRVSIGAFDLDAIRFPTALRFANAGEEIVLLGDKEPTKYSEKEIAYFDTIGGYNIDFNYRDSQRTAVSESTKNIMLNVDGVYDILPSQVERSLQEAIDIIKKYCGGTVTLQGVVTTTV